MFAGGTARARAHKLVRRMSEDVDFKIVAPADLAMSNNQRRNQLGALRDRITAGFLGAGFAIDVADARQLHSCDANRYTVYTSPRCKRCDCRIFSLAQGYRLACLRQRPEGRCGCA